MRTEQGQALESLLREHRAKVAAVRADGPLSWEQQEKAIKALGDEFDRQRRELEED